MTKKILRHVFAAAMLLGTLGFGSESIAAVPIIPGYERWLNEYIDWGSENGFSHQQVVQWTNDHPDYRIIDLEVEEFFGISESAMKKNRFAFIWIENIGDFKADTIIDFFLGKEALDELKTKQEWRPIDLEVSLIGINPVYTIVRVPHGGYDWTYIPFMPDEKYNTWHASIVAAGFRPVDVEAGFGDAHVDVLFGAGLYVDNPENLKFELTHFGEPNHSVLESILDLQLIDADPVPKKWADAHGYQAPFFEYIGVFTEIPQSTHFVPDLLKEEHDMFAMVEDVRMIDIERTGEIKHECEDGFASKCNPLFESPGTGPIYLGVYLETYKFNQPGDPGDPGSDGSDPNRPPD